jgi:ribonuclease HI
MTAVSIYTDAGILHGRGSWATVILSADRIGPVEQSGLLRGVFKSSAAVEGAAMANALHFAKRRGLVERGDVVTILSDCQAIIARINCEVRKDAKDPDIMRAAAYVAEWSASLGVQVRAVWVKGHQRLDSLDPHAIYNNRCDKLATAAREGRTAIPFAEFAAFVAERHRMRQQREARANPTRAARV